MKPIIFIPGIEATALVNANTFGFDVIWNAYDTLGTALVTKVGGPYIEERLLKNGRYDENISNIIERNHMARLPYEKTFYNLTAKLKDSGDNSPLYLFGYDWRLSNVVNGKRLLDFTNYLKEKILSSGQIFEGFRFVTHSMGGMVLSCYISKLDTPEVEVDRVIMCAPPFLGSPYPIIHLVKGDGGFKSFLNSIFGRDEDIRKVVRTYPALYELLPFYSNPATYGNPVTFEDDHTPVDLTKIENWQTNVYAKIEDLFKQRLADLIQYRNQDRGDLSQLSPAMRSRMLVVAGSGSNDSTLTALKVRRHGPNVDNYFIIDEKDKLTMGSGDGTVPYDSAIAYKDSIETLVLPKLSVLHEVSDNIDYHGMFLRDSRMQNILCRFMMLDLSVPPPVIAGAPWWASVGGNILPA